MRLFSKLRLPYRGNNFFGVLFLIAFLIPLAFDVYNYESFEIIKFGLLLVLCGFALLVFSKKYPGGSHNGLTLRSSKSFFIGLLLFWFWAFLASLLALDRNYSFFGFYPRFTNGFLFYSLWAALFFFLALLDKAQLWVLIKVLFFCSLLVAVWGMLQSLGIGYYGGPALDFFSRAAPSFLGNPDFSSMFVAVLVPIGLALLYFAKTFSAKVYYGISLFFQVWSVIIFASRGAFLSLVAGLCLAIIIGFIFRRVVPKKILLSLVLLLLLTLTLSRVFLSLARPGVVQTTLDLQDVNIQDRLGVWHLSLESIRQEPVFGFGLGNFELVFEKYRNLTTVTSGYFDDPHNLFLYLAVSGGLPFLLLFLYLFGHASWQGLDNLIKKRQSEAVESLALLSALAVWAAAACFTPVPIACYLLLVFLLSAFYVKTVFLPFKGGMEKGLRFSAALIGVALAAYGFCFIAAEHLFFASISNYNNDNFLTSEHLARAAVILNPANNLYYEYLAGSAIRAGFPLQDTQRDIKEFAQFHPGRSNTYSILASLDYLLLYQTQNSVYKASILKNLDVAISLDPFDSENYFTSAQYQLIFGNLQESQGYLQKGLELDPSNSGAEIFLAKIYQYQGDRQGMVSALEAALRVGGYTPALLNLLNTAKTAPDIRSLPFDLHLSPGALS